MPVEFGTTLSVTNEIDKRGKQILSLIDTYIPGFHGKYYGHRPIGLDDLVFPAVMVEPVSELAEMYTTAKYTIQFTFHIYFYVLNNDRDALVTKQTEAMECLVKLFSNNALDDIGSGNTNKFKANPGFWIQSTMKEITLSSTFSWTRPDYPQFARAGLFALEVEDRIIH